MPQIVNLVVRSRLVIGIIAALLSATATFQACKTQPERSPKTVAIAGTVTEYWEGRPRPVTGLTVYVLDTKEYNDIRAILDMLEHFPAGDSTEGVRQFGQLYDALTGALRPIDQQREATKTDSSGRYEKGQLSAGESYIVLAIDSNRGDSNDVAYYRYALTEPLKERLTTHDFYMGPGAKEDCRGN